MYAMEKATETLLDHLPLKSCCRSCKLDIGGRDRFRISFSASGAFLGNMLYTEHMLAVQTLPASELDDPLKVMLNWKCSNVFTKKRNKNLKNLSWTDYCNSGAYLACRMSWTKRGKVYTLSFSWRLMALTWLTWIIAHIGREQKLTAMR